MAREPWHSSLLPTQIVYYCICVNSSDQVYSFFFLHIQYGPNSNEVLNMIYDIRSSDFSVHSEVIVTVM